jgi:hypothetical protein
VYYITSCQCHRENHALTDIRFTLEDHRVHPEEDSTIVLSLVTLPAPLQKRIFALITLLEQNASRIALHTNAPYDLVEYSLSMAWEQRAWRIMSAEFLFLYSNSGPIVINSECKLRLDDLSLNVILELQATIDNIAKYVDSNIHVTTNKYQFPTAIASLLCTNIMLSSLHLVTQGLLAL